MFRDQAWPISEDGDTRADTKKRSIKKCVLLHSVFLMSAAVYHLWRAIQIYQGASIAAPESLSLSHPIPSRYKFLGILNLGSTL